MTHLSYTLRNAMLRLVDAPQRTFSKVTSRLGSGVRPALASTPPPPSHVTARLEAVFEGLSELAFQPHVAAALTLACDVLSSELPTEAVAAGLYDIDADEIRFVAARGVGDDLLRGTAIAREQCLVGGSSEHAVITTGEAGQASWIGAGGADSTVLLCPVLRDGELLGVLGLADPLCAARFDGYDVELVGYVAAQLSDFIQAQRQRQGLGQRAAASSA